jgi:hypothetical protein
MWLPHLYSAPGGASGRKHRYGEIEGTFLGRPQVEVFNVATDRSLAIHTVVLYERVHHPVADPPAVACRFPLVPSRCSTAYISPAIGGSVAAVRATTPPRSSSDGRILDAEGVCALGSHLSKQSSFTLMAKTQSPPVISSLWYPESLSTSA